MKKNAFTLAEVLVTLSIIGVVSALTLPSLVSNHHKRVMSAQSQKFYNQFSNAIVQYKADNKTDDVSAIFNSATNRSNFAKNYFQLSRNCGESTLTATECLAHDYRTLNSATYSISFLFPAAFAEYEANQNANDVAAGVVGNTGYCASLNTSAAFCLLKHTQGGLVVFDVNGLSKPNMKGRDLYSFIVTKDGDIKDSASEDKCKSASSKYAEGCFGMLMENNWEIDY